MVYGKLRLIINFNLYRKTASKRLIGYVYVDKFNGRKEISLALGLNL